MTLAAHPILNSEPTLSGSFIDKLFDDGRKLIADATKEITKITAVTLAKPDFTGVTPNLENPSDITLAGLPTAPTKPILDNVPIDAFPDKPILTTALIATDSLLTATIARIIGQIEQRINYATGLSPTVEAAIFGRGVDRETKQTQAAYQAYIDNQAAMGWSSPSGQDRAAFIAFEAEKKGKLSDLSRDIMTKQADLEQANTQRNLELYQNLQAQLFSQKQSDEANKIQLFSTSVDAVIKKAQLYIDINKSWVDIFSNEVEAYKALANVGIDEAKFRMDQVSALNAMNTQLSSVAMQKLNIMLEYEKSNAALATEGAKGIAAVMGQLAATQMNAISLGESFSYGKHWSYGESVSV